MFALARWATPVADRDALVFASGPAASGTEFTKAPRSKALAPHRSQERKKNKKEQTNCLRLRQVSVLGAESDPGQVACPQVLVQNLNLHPSCQMFETTKRLQI